MVPFELLSLSWRRFGAMVVATRRRGETVTADDIGVGGPLAVLMNDTIKPNLMQTLEGTPVFIHAGPFANIAHGNSSILAGRAALNLAGAAPSNVGYVLTEGGFGADMGVEKFCNIKYRFNDLYPDAVAIVATTRALKIHGGGLEATPGKPLVDTKIWRHVETAKKFGVRSSLLSASFHLIRIRALEAASQPLGFGSAGAKPLAKAVIAAYEASTDPPQFNFLYELDLPIAQKIEAIAKEIYRADGIELSELAKSQVENHEKQRYGNLPICMDKTQYSFSHDPKLKGTPTGFTVPMRAVRLSAGALLLYPLLGDKQSIPALGTRPGSGEVGLDEATGRAVGLF